MTRTAISPRLAISTFLITWSPEPEPLDLAGRGLGQIVDEHDGPGNLVACGPLLDPGAELGGQSVGLGDARRRVARLEHDGSVRVHETIAPHHADDARFHHH